MSTPINMMNFSEKTRYRKLRELMKIKAYENKTELVKAAELGQTSTIKLINRFNLWPILSSIEVTEPTESKIMDAHWLIPNRAFKQNLYS